MRFPLSSILIFGAVLLFSQLRSEDAPAPSSRLLANDTVEYFRGTLPLIIAAPHGGTLKPGSIPDRKDGVTQRDAETDLLAREVAEAVANRTGSWPHLVICHLHRSKVDCNRDALTGTAGNKEALATWEAFHAAIEEARAASDRGLFIDLHGHSHNLARTEIGYRLDAAQLQFGGEAFNALAESSSIAALMTTTPDSFEKLARGPVSLGALLAERGYDAVPSPGAPDPGLNPYFRGGHNTELYGSKGTKPRWASIQIECPKPGVRDTEENRRKFAAALAESLEIWILRHAKLRLSRDAGSE